MQIMGLQKITLLDYPGYVASTIFTGGCNFRCPFCQNASLVNLEEDIIDENYILDYLEGRKNIIDAVCISGGEPTLQPDLKKFIRKIKKMGYLVKLDTNGTNPKLIKELIEEKLIDYIAMDIKNSKEKYNITSGKEINFKEIEESINLLINGNVEYEFRTTVVYEYHDDQDFINIAKLIKGAKLYVLQQFQDSGNLLEDGLHSHKKEKLYEFKNLLNKKIKNIEIRGI